MKNVDRCFPKTEIVSSNIWSCPQPEDIQIRNQKEFTFKKVKSHHFDCFC